MKRRPRSASSQYDYDYDRDDDFSAPDPNPRGNKPKGNSLFNATSLAIIAGIFILGIGVGIAFSSATPSQQDVVVSGLQIDQKAPNPEVCIQNGASAISMNTKLYVTLNPFKVYVAQAAMEPACVLRRANWAILEQRKLLSNDQSRDCRQKMNTFGYTGNLDNKPNIDCVYQSDNAKNFFLGGGGASAPSIEGGDQF